MIAFPFYQSKIYSFCLAKYAQNINLQNIPGFEIDFNCSTYGYKNIDIDEQNLDIIELKQHLYDINCWNHDNKHLLSRQLNTDLNQKKIEVISNELTETHDFIQIDGIYYDQLLLKPKDIFKNDIKTLSKLLIIALFKNNFQRIINLDCYGIYSIIQSDEQQTNAATLCVIKNKQFNNAFIYRAVHRSDVAKRYLQTMQKQKCNEYGFLEWNIDGESMKQFKSAEKGKQFRSPSFKSLDGTVWRIKFMPNGRKNYCCIALQLIKLSSNKFKIGVNYFLEVMEVNWKMNDGDTFKKDGKTHRGYKIKMVERSKILNLSTLTITAKVQETMDFLNENINQEIKWNINNDLLDRVKKAEFKKVFYSPRFNVIEAEWCLQIYPSGDDVSNNFSIYLKAIKLDSSKQQIGINYLVNIKEVNYNCDAASTFKKNYSAGINAFETWKLLKLSTLTITIQLEETMDFWNENNELKWIINNDLLDRFKKCEFDISFSSPVFIAIGTKWRFRIWPNGGIQKKLKGTALIMLYCIGDTYNHPICYNIQIEEIMFSEAYEEDGIVLIRQRYTFASPFQHEDIQELLKLTVCFKMWKETFSIIKQHKND
eukprot:483858_1